MGKGLDTIEIKNAEMLASKLKSYSIKAESELEKAILKGCLVIEGEAKTNSAVDTGYMRASITHQLSKQKGKTVGLVGTNTEYAPHIEYGTVKMKSQPFLRPAYENHIKQIKQDIRKAMKW
jgi:HK97 gp10 family phage protein